MTKGPGIPRTRPLRGVCWWMESDGRETVMEETLLWYDFETWGNRVASARPVQVAFLRTDLDLEPVDDGYTYYCRPSGDFLPSPVSTAIHGITPRFALEEGEIESEFAGMVFEDMSHPGSCCVGYNSEKFDSKIARFLFWRNFLPPYRAEHDNGNSKWDLRNVVLAAYALRPDGIRWPRAADGSTSLRLEDLARENGLGHESAHDALSDVEATVALARLVRTAQPNLYDWALGQRTTRSVERFVADNMGRAVAHVSPLYGYDRRGVAPLLLVARSAHASQNRDVFAIDLGRDPEALFRMAPDELRTLLHAPRESLEEGTTRPPIVRIKTNECPFLAPIGTVDGGAALRAGIDMDVCRANQRRLSEHGDLAALLQEVHAPPARESLPDVDEALYGGFVGRRDEARSWDFRNADPADLGSFRGTFDDARLNEMVFRFRGRNYPETFGPAESRAWKEFCRARLLDAPEGAVSRYDAFRAEIEPASALCADDPDRRARLAEAEEYGEALVASLR